jgi:hypothetical protein
MQHEARGPACGCEQPACLVLTQNNRQSRQALRTLQVLQLADLHAEHLAVQEEQRAQRLFRSAGRYLALDGEVVQVGLHVIRSEL